MQSVQTALQQVQDFTRLPIKQMSARLVEMGNCVDVTVPADRVTIGEDMELAGLVDVWFSKDHAHLVFDLIH